MAKLLGTGLFFKNDTQPSHSKMLIMSALQNQSQKFMVGFGFRRN
jgi:hypothetical protein